MKEDLNVAVIGGGGREAALIQALLMDTTVATVFMFGSNHSFPRDPHVVPTGIKASDKSGIVRACQELGIDLVVSGPELPAVNGTNDSLREVGIPVFGASSQAIRIESDKAWAREVMRQIGLPQPYFEVRTDVETAKLAVKANEVLRVVKATGPCEGKGVIVCDSLEETLAAIDLILVERAFGSAGDTIVLEERLGWHDPVSQEVSVMYFTDGKNAIPMPLVRDYKREFDGDRGSNTGSMGCHTNPESLSPEEQTQVLETMALPLLNSLAQQNNPFVGILYVSLMTTSRGMYVIEINGRGGDPETVVQLAGLSHPHFAQFLLACAQGELAGTLSPSWDTYEYLDLIMCASDYPREKSHGEVIEGIVEASELTHRIFHAGTTHNQRHLVTNGGRILHLLGRGQTLEEAKSQAYAAAEKIRFNGRPPKYRNDIGSPISDIRTP